LPVWNGGTDFNGIEIASTSKSVRKRIKAKKEIIVSGGVIGSPQILMNSGVGKKDELESVGINVLVDNPSVGKNFSDHVSVYLVFQTTMEATDE
jgi:choline dehydrogenase